MSLFNSITSTIESTIRAIDTTRVFTKSGVGLLLNNLTKEKKTMAATLRNSFEELGATYIKLGQLIASAHGLFPKEYVEEMQKCLDRVTPLPFCEIEKILKREFGGELYSIFKKIGKTPLASASIAQVHPATLSSGEDVVIKVQKPGIKKTLNADLNILYLAAFIFEKLTLVGARRSLTEIVNEFHKTIMEEVDFFQEAQNIKEFHRFLNSIGESNVVVPKFYQQASTARVLTMERLYGVPLTETEVLNKDKSFAKNALIHALNVWFQSIFHCGFFHADLHAGNLLLLEDGKVAFIDFGIIGRMEQKIWEALIDLIEGLYTKNYKLIANSLVNINATDKKVNITEFSRQLEKIFQNFYKVQNNLFQKREVDQSEINTLMMNLVEVSQENGLRIPREFSLLFKQILYFERYTKLIAPELDIVSADNIIMRPVLN